MVDGSMLDSSWSPVSSAGTSYVASKLAVAGVLPLISEATAMSSVWARLFWLYGPYEKTSRLVPSVILSLLDDQPASITAGHHVRDFLHVDDVAAALVRLAESGLTGPVNCGSGLPVTVWEIAETVAAVVGHRDLLRAEPQPDRSSVPTEIWADNTLLRSTGWAQETTLQEGITGTVEWCRSHRDRRLFAR
ncbi:MAG: NAD-dependent epimerase/dehydratase family protein [Acidimicrobiales bacterium]